MQFAALVLLVALLCQEATPSHGDITGPQVSDASTPEHHTLISYPDPVGDTQPFSERHSPSDGNRLLLSDKVQTTSPKSDDRPPSCPEAKCFVDLIHGQEGRQDLFSLKCGGCNRKLSWEVSDWLAAKIRSGALQGVNVKVVPVNTSASEAAPPLMAFDAVLNNVAHLMLTANVRGLEPLLPRLSKEGGYKVQQDLFRIDPLYNVTLASSTIQGLAPLQAVARPEIIGNVTHVRVQGCTFSNTHLALLPLEASADVYEPACMLSLGARFRESHVEVINTTFKNITTSAPPGSALWLSILCAETGSNDDTVTMRDTTFFNISDALGDSLDLIYTSFVYQGRLHTKSFTMQRCQFANIKASLLAKLDTAAVMVDNCTVRGAHLASGGFAVMSRRIQKADFLNSTFSNIQLGAASEATGIDQDYYNPGVGLVKTGSMAMVHVQGCLFKNVSLLPSASQPGSTANMSRQTTGTAPFIRTAVVAAGADCRVAYSVFEDCYTPAAVYAFSGEKETLGRVYGVGTANRGSRNAVVSLVLHESKFLRNMYGVYANGFQVIVSSCIFTNSSVSGMDISGVPCLVVNGTMLRGAAISVQRASNPGGTAFSFCRMGWFPRWLNDKVQDAASIVPVTARAAAVRHNISGQLTDAFDAAVSVYLESIDISHVHGQPALFLRDIHKASLQRVSITGSVGAGALQANSVVGMLMLQCYVVNNSAQSNADGLNTAGGATFTAVRSLYLLDTVFAGNVGPQAGAVLLLSCGPVVINSCTLHHNNASGSGGGVRAVASESILVDTSKLLQPENISCMQADVLSTMYYSDQEFMRFNLDLSNSVQDNVVCPRVVLGGRATNFHNNVAGASGGAIAIEGLTLAAFDAKNVNFVKNRAHVSGGAVAVLGVDQHVTWSLSRASLLRNSAAGSGGALAFTVPVQGVLCQHCILHDNKAGLLGGALFSTARELCMSRRNQQECIGGNTTFTNNMASAGGSIAYIVDAAAAGLFSTTPTNNTRGPSFHRSIPTAVQEGSLQCTRLNLNRTGSTLGVAGPPCALVLWSPAAGTMLPYVNNGSGLPTINATVVDCWCSTIQQLPGIASSASLTPLTARLMYNNIVLFEQAVGPQGEIVFDKVDFNQPPQRYNLTLQLSPTTESALAADAPKPLPITLTVQARPCTTGEELGTDGRCRQCSAGTYGRNGQCMQCKPGASCPGGALMLPQEGWWHSTPASDVFKPCLQAQACRGSREQLKAYQQEHYDDLERAMTQRALLASVELDYQSAMCSEGYKGHLCSTCGPNRSKTRNYVCGTCTGGGRVVLITLIGTVLGMAYLWFISASTIKDSQAPWGTLKVSDATYCLTWFLQLLFVLATVPVTWPTAISWLPKTAETLLSSFSSSTSSLACLVKPSQSMPSIAGQMMIIQLCLMLIMPVVVVLLQLLSAACKPVIRKLITCLKAQARRPGVVPRTARASRTAKSFPWKQDIIVTVLSSLLFFYPTILQSTMSLFVCKPLDPAGGSERVYQAQSNHGWWMSDLDVKCFSSWHAKFALAFGLPCLLLLCLGIPLVAAAASIRAWMRNELQEDHYRQVYGFLHSRYRDDRWYYNIVQRSWLLVLVVCVVFTSGDTMLQLFVYEAVLMASLVCLIVFNPTESPVAGRLDVFVTLTALLNGFAAVFCVASTTDSAAITGSSFGMGSSGRDGLGVVVVVTNVVVLLSIIAFIIKVYVATSPRVGQAVDKMITWGASLKP